MCCPENTFGPNCEECPGGVETPCGEHGTCKVSASVHVGGWDWIAVWMVARKYFLMLDFSGCVLSCGL